MHSLQVVLIFAVLSSTLAHLCLFNPKQRGSLNGYTSPGANDCALLSGPCGRSASSPVIYAQKGSNFTIVFQKNLDHWYQANPGNFTVNWSTTVSNDFEFVATVPDDGEPSLTYYEVMVTVPNMIVKHGVLQVVYYTNNPSAPPSFWQCADFGIVP